MRERRNATLAMARSTAPDVAQFLSSRPAPIALPASPATGAFPAPDDVDGMGAVVTASALLFAADLRLNEVRRLLQSSRPLALRLSSTHELTDHDMLHEQQPRLLLVLATERLLLAAQRNIGKCDWEP